MVAILKLFLVQERSLNKIMPLVEGPEVIITLHYLVHLGYGVKYDLPCEKVSPPPRGFIKNICDVI